ncbi:MAG: hypothetical protein V4549_03515 [Bacteroidota bacterium]
MDSEVKYYKAKKGYIVSDGVIKVRFVKEVFCTSDLKEMSLLKKSVNVTETTFEEAVKVFPDLVKQEEKKEEKKVDPATNDNAPDDDSATVGPTRKVLEARARELKVSEDDIKKAKNKAEVAALVKTAEDAEGNS